MPERSQGYNRASLRFRVRLTGSLPKLVASGWMSEAEAAFAVSQGVDGVYEEIHTHFAAYAATHHKTAERLGASPTNVLVDAAENIAVTKNPRGGSIRINAPGIRRAFEGFDVVPKNAKALTIPLIAAAYGKRAREYPGELKVVKAKSGRAYLVDEDTGEGVYLLLKHVYIPHDPDMLPDNRTMNNAFREGILAYISEKIGVIR